MLLNKSVTTKGFEVYRRYLCSNAYKTHSCKLLVVGGGTGGTTMAAKFARKMKQDEIIVVEPSERHYYQPLFTMVGGGIKKFDQSYRKTKDCLPSKVKWIKDKVVKFNPDSNSVVTEDNCEIKYDYMLVALGLKLDYNKIPGFLESLKIPDSMVCSNYSPRTVSDVYPTFKKFKSGNAIFTFPNTGIKCPGGPQKICYIFDDYLRKNNMRDKAHISYNTSLPVIFGVKYFADALWKVANRKNITVNTQTYLKEIFPEKKEALFHHSDTGKDEVVKYGLLHVVPPMSTPNGLKECESLVNEAGFLDVDKYTLQHTKYKNIFGIGDCTNTPNSKTMAAVAAQAWVIDKYMSAMMFDKPLKSGPKYDGYASCPLVTGYGKCILAEFNYDLLPQETLPIRQDRETWYAYLMKRDGMPLLYWQLMVRGYWNGPAMIRTILHLGMK